MIPKREFNPELSAFSNLILDLVDFKDRVRPLARDISLLDATQRYQARSVSEVEEERKMHQAMRKEMGWDQESTTDKKEISELSSEDAAAVPGQQKRRFKFKQ